MKFKHIHIKNFQQLVPSWACDVFATARTLDGLLDDSFVRKMTPIVQGDLVSGKVGFWIELDILSESLRVVTPSDDGVDNREQFIITTNSIIGEAKAQIQFPIIYILKGFSDIDGTHSIYLHSFNTDTPIGYIGLSKNPWHKRFNQHIELAKSGSSCLFHRAIREHCNDEVMHKVWICGLSKDKAFELEEEFVAKATLYPLGLNMIPGGNAGIRYLHKLGIDARSAVDRDKAIEDLAERDTIDGAPNPLCAARWASDPDFVERVICGHSGRLTADQVRTIRLHSSFGRSPSEILPVVGARNLRQVNNVLRLKYYSRIEGVTA